jgi:pimeloyl-ACP methyl ester carboxylesterase
MSQKNRRQRDGQQWILDYLCKTAGMVQNFEDDRPELPPGTKSYRMISKLQGEDAARKESVARALDEAGHSETALEAYVKAAESYRKGQHVIFEDDHPQKHKLYAGLVRCYDRVMALADYPIERIDVPFEGQQIQIILHLLPDRRQAPCILYIPGMDQTKEFYPYVYQNDMLRRGMHSCAMDGPGQGISNIRKIRVTADNYERAVKAVIDVLIERPEIDKEKIGVFGISMGSFWAPRAAAFDSRIKACAGASATFANKNHIFNVSSPRFKQVFMYMAGISDEDEFDDMAATMTLASHCGKIRCPTLLATGEFDPLSPVEEGLAVFDELGAPKELWILENEFHRVWAMQGLAGMDLNAFAVDWLRDALNGKIPENHNKTVYVRQKSGRAVFDDALPSDYPGRW